MSRKPTFIYTEAYLNDPVRFIPDSRFFLEPIVRDVETVELYSRNPDGFITVDTNDISNKMYSVLSINSVYSRFNIASVVDTIFHEL